jgi:hypothetical protein
MKVDYSLFSAETQVAIARWREMVLNGTDTPEELQQAIIAMREGRCAASVAAAKSGGTRAKRVTKADKIAAVDVNKAMEGF